MQARSGGGAVIFDDRLASRREFALDPSGVGTSGAEKKNCGRECAAGYSIKFENG
jgi:hypothetical protein